MATQQEQFRENVAAAQDQVEKISAQARQATRESAQAAQQTQQALAPCGPAWRRCQAPGDRLKWSPAGGCPAVPARRGRKRTGALPRSSFGLLGRLGVERVHKDLVLFVRDVHLNSQVLLDRCGDRLGQRLAHRRLVAQP